MKISILGCGVFGSALFSYFSRKGYEIYKDEILDSNIIFVSVPSSVVCSALLKLKNEIKDQDIIICSKGLNEDGGLISVCLEKNFPNNKILFLYGPTIAEGLKNGDLCGMVLAGKGDKDKLKNIIESDSLKIEISEDVIGVQVGASLKNVMTILMGVVEGADFKENTQAFVFTRCLEEIQNIGIKMGANKETFTGLSCLGDLTLYSRNRYLGTMIGKGEDKDEIIKKMNYTPEGLVTLLHVKKIVDNLKIKTQLIDILYGILFEGKDIKSEINKIK